MRTALLILLFLLSANFLHAQEPLFQFKSSIVPELGIRRITVDNDGYLYILQASKISKFKDGKLINNFHIDQSEYINSYIDAPTDIAVDNEKNFYLLNLNKRRIEKHDSAGKLIITFDIVDSFPEPDKVFLPWEISFDAEDNLYVYGFNRLIQVYNTEGKLIRTIDIPKLEAPNDDTGISHITLYTHGNFYILEEVKNTNGWYMLLNKYDNNGNHLKDLSTDPIKNKVSIANMAVDKNGDIYFTNRSFHNVDVYTPDGEYKHRINVEEGTNNWTKAIHFNIEFDQQNNVLLGGSNDHGSLFYAYNQNSILLYKLGDIRHPYEVAFDHENNILILDEVKKRVLKLGLDGKLISSINNLYVPKGLASDKRGNIYIISAGITFASILKYNSEGVFLKSYSNIESYNAWSDNWSGSSYVSAGIAIDDEENMYVTSHNTNALTKYNSDGKILYQIKEAGKEKGKLWKPNDVALDASGFVYVTDINGKRIQKLSPDGLFLEECGTYALNEENKYVRSSIAADAFGNVLLSSNYTIKPVYYSIKGTPQYQLPVKTNSLAFSQDGKYLITADPFLDKIDIYETNIVSEYNYVHGKVYADFNANCIADASEIGISKILIKAEPGPFYAITDKAGNYQLLVEAGSYNVAPIINETNRTGVLIDQSCAIGNDPLPVQFSNTGNLLLSNNFGAKVTLSPYLSTSISSTRRRRCFESTTKVTYSNSGFAPAENAKVHVQLPEQIEFLSADKPYTRLADGTYVFDVGTVAAGQNSVITIQDMVKCGDEGIRGLTVCTKVWITDSKPLPPAATTIITGKCNPETGYVRFALKNIGQLSMDTGELFRIYLDGQLATIETYRLATGDSLVLWIPTGGKTVRLEADQPDGNGENKQASVTVEACQNTNTPAPVPFSTGFVNAMPTDDEEAKVSVECLPITDSYDPNDKLVSPIGLTEENYTPTNAALKYKIRFQNTGTDVAYRVVLVDTLSENLDLSTLQMGSASHPYRFDVSGKGKPVLTWTFDNIKLPDSTSNEPGSHGFIQFSIKPKADLPEKTTVENFADIFFDFNSPVRTNTTLNRIFDMPPVVNEEVRLDADQIIASPSITDFTPAAGKFGEEIILAGKNFSSTPEQNKVYFNGTLATVVSASATELKMLVPASATTGNLKVITPDGGAQAPESFEVYQPPVVREFSPIEGIVGSTVTIEGNGLTTDWLQRISLGSETCEIISATGTTAVVKVPQGAVSGKFEIITKGGEVNSTKQFVVWHQPVISGLSSYLDKVGATITISGENFASEALRNIVLFEKVQAQVLESSATQLKVRVPAGVSIANVAVETPGGKATTPKPFEVIPAPVLFSFSPASGPVGTEVTLVGENFLAIGIQDTLTLNGDKVQLLSSASDKFTIRIPRGASTGKVKVAGIGGYSVSATDFVVEELSAEEAIEVYPNPSTGHFTIRFVHADFDIQSVQVYTSVGRLIHTQPVSSPRPENLEVDITKAKAGMYLLRIQTDRGLILKKLNVL